MGTFDMGLFFAKLTKKAYLISYEYQRVVNDSRKHKQFKLLFITFIR